MEPVLYPSIWSVPKLLLFQIMPRLSLAHTTLHTDNCGGFLQVGSLSQRVGAFVIWTDPAKPASRGAPKGPFRYTLRPARDESVCFPTVSPAENVSKLWNRCQSSGCGFNCISLILSETERLSTFLFCGLPVRIFYLFF